MQPASLHTVRWPRVHTHAADEQLAGCQLGPWGLDETLVFWGLHDATQSCNRCVPAMHRSVQTPCEHCLSNAHRDASGAPRHTYQCQAARTNGRPTCPGGGHAPMASTHGAPLHACGPTLTPSCVRSCTAHLPPHVQARTDAVHARTDGVHVPHAMRPGRPCSANTLDKLVAWGGCPQSVWHLPACRACQPACTTP